MGSIWIKEFTGGLDTRRLPETTPGGVLLQAVNGHISRGGEFEKRAAFIEEYALPPGTVGLAYKFNGIMVFGSGVAPTLPKGVQYQRLQHANGITPLVAINSFDLFAGKPYVSATFADGTIYHFYDGARVAYWVDGSAGFIFSVTGGHNTPATVASGKISVTSGSNGVTNKLTDLKVGAVSIIGRQVQHTGDNAATAVNVAAEINRHTSTPDYTAVPNGVEITIIAAVTGPALNGLAITATVIGDFAMGAMTPMAGGADRNVSTLDLVVGTDDIMDPVEWRTSNAETAKAVTAAINDYQSIREFHAVWDNSVGVSIVANEPGIWANNLVVTPTYTNGFLTSIAAPNDKLLGGVDPAVPPTTGNPGSFVMTAGSKMYALSGPNLHFSGVGDATGWATTVTGAGFIDMSQEASGSEELTAISKYQSYLAVFSGSNILIEYIDPDPTLNKLSQVLNNTGTESPHSVCQFGDNDIFYLDESGVRSLRARDSSNSASTSDIGVLVDSLVTTRLKMLSTDQRQKIFGLIEPEDGRFWLIMGDEIFVFSYFSGVKVSAWSTYRVSRMVDGEEVPFAVEEAITFRRRVYVRSGDKIYVYGGLSKETRYDEVEAIMQTPFLDANAPAKVKDYNGFDTAVSGVWSVSASLDPNNLQASDLLGIIDESTFPHNRMPMQGASSHASLTFKSRSALAAKIGSGLIHYTADGEDDGTR